MAWRSQDGPKHDGGIRIKEAVVVLSDGVFRGNIEISNGKFDLIEAAEEIGNSALGRDLDIFLPGLIDLHTDNIEHYMQPRPGVRWPSALAAVLAHDWEMLGSGITTVFDAIALGDYDSAGARTALLDAEIGALGTARSSGLLKADHYLHFRCELSDPGLLPMFERHIDTPNLRLVSMMDHTPGQRQWHDLRLYRAFRSKKNARVWSEDEFALYIEERRRHQELHVPAARSVIGNVCRDRSIRLASHDDTTLADVEESHGDGIAISEFPTTIEAARRARELGMATVMGAPNVVLGGSHSGNVSAADLADAGLLDILASDYVTGSLLQAPFVLAGRGMPIHEAIAMVTARPAEALGLTDRGRIAPGLRADLLRVRLVDGVPIIRNIWVAGRQYL